MTSLGPEVNNPRPNANIKRARATGYSSLLSLILILIGEDTDVKTYWQYWTKVKEVFTATCK